MKNRLLIGQLTFAVTAMMFLAPRAQAVKFTLLHSFEGKYVTNSYDGLPQAPLVQASDGNFYGMTDGSLFKMTPAGIATTLLVFNGTNGHSPRGGLIQGPDGALYGTTYEGGLYTNYGYAVAHGYGTVFKLTTNGTFTSMIAFNNTNAPKGALPRAGLVARTNDGNLYGVTEAGGRYYLDDFGSPQSGGTVFKITPDGVLTTLVEFDARSDPFSSFPNGGLMLGRDGNFYGATSWWKDVFNYAGNGTDGSIFMMTPAGAITVLSQDFAPYDGANPKGAFPQGPLLEDGDGNLYGMTTDGGNYNGGTIFRLDTSGILTVLIHFDGTNGFTPLGGLMRARDGNFYGTTLFGGPHPLFAPPGQGDDEMWPDSGTVFKLTPGGTLTTIYACVHTNGHWPSAGLIQGRDGKLYGTAALGGAYGIGTVFSLSVDPSILTEPNDVAVPLGSNATFSVTAEGTPELSYQWRFNGTPLAGASNSSLTISNAQCANIGSYDVVVSNSVDWVNSLAAKLTIVGPGTNLPPVANPQSLVTPTNTPLAVTLSGSDPNGDPLVFTVVTPPSHGSLSGAAPSLLYTPLPNYSGADGLTFEVNDGQSCPARAVVSIWVNTAPVAASQSVSTPEDTSLPITLTASDADGDSLCFTTATPPAHGTLSGVPPNLTYLPTPSYYGSDGFTFSANDGHGGVSQGTIAISVTPVNHPPVANAQSLTAYQNTPLPIALAGVDADGDPLAFSIVTPPAHGALSGTVPSLTYTPVSGYTGSDSFTFLVTDPGALSGTAIVNIGIVSPLCPNNVVTNSGFETGLGYWAGYGNSTITAANSPVHGGAASVYVTGRTASWTGLSQRLDGLLQDGTTYIFSGWMYVESTTSQPLSVALQVVDDAGTANYTMNTTYGAQGNGWVQVYGGLTMHFSGTPSVIRLSFSGPPAGVNFYVDDVDVRCINLPSDGNLVQNGGFELGTVNWYNWDGSGFANLITANSPVHGGLRASACVNRSVSWSGPGQDLTGVLQPGSNYLLTAWVRVQNGLPQAPQATLYKSDSGGTTSTGLTALQGVAAGSGWVQLQTTFVYTLSGTLSRLALYFEAVAPVAGKNYLVDDVSIVPWSSAPLAQESFKYLSGTSLAGQATGVGFNSTWSGSGTSYTVNSGSLSYPGLVTSSGRLSLVAPSGNSTQTRTLLAPLGAAGTTRYVSCVVRPDSVPAGTVVTNGWFGLQLNGNTGANFYFGKPGGGVLTNYAIENAGGSLQVTSTVPVIAGSNTLLVVRCDFTAGIDTFTLFINPTPGLPEPASGVVKSNADVGTVSSVTISGGAAFTIDELRIGATYADVVPATCAPTFLLQPVGLTTTSGLPATFSVLANAGAALSYQWRKNGVVLYDVGPISGSHTATLTINPTSGGDAGQYDAVALTPCSSTNSTAATLVVVTGTTDTDGDGLPDLWESARGLNPNDPSDAARDDDHDGMTNLQEYLAGTDPQNAADRLALESPHLDTGGLSVTLNAKANRTYSILYKNSLADPVWQKWQDVPAQATDHTVSISIPVNGSASSLFRVVTPAMP